VAGATAAAGLVIGGITMTGLASKFAHLVYAITAADQFMTFVVAAALTIVLGMGIVTIDSLWVSLMLLPIMPLGIIFGKYINTRLPKEPFYVVVHVLLIILGCYLIGNALIPKSA
jgi:TRAP-type uncharacterized transport system fused permease subunit